MHQGNFSDLGPGINIPNPFVPARFLVTLFPRQTSTAWVRISSIYFLFQTFPGAGNEPENFIFNGKYKFDETAFETRFDYNITSNDRFFAHYAIATPNATNPSNFPNVDGGAGSGTSSTLNNRVQSLAGDWTHIFNPGLLNDLRAGLHPIQRRHSAP